MIRITLDTNQLVRALMRPPELATLVMAWQSSRFQVVASTQVIEEYERVLVYPEIARLIFPELVRIYHSHLIQLIEVVSTPVIASLCRDPDDDKVIAAAIYGEVQFLVSEDDGLRTRKLRTMLKQNHEIEVISTQELIAILDETSS